MLLHADARALPIAADTGFTFYLGTHETQSDLFSRTAQKDLAFT